MRAVAGGAPRRTPTQPPPNDEWLHSPRTRHGPNKNSTDPATLLFYGPLSSGCDLAIYSGHVRPQPERTGTTRVHPPEGNEPLSKAHCRRATNTYGRRRQLRLRVKFNKSLWPCPCYVTNEVLAAGVRGAGVEQYGPVYWPKLWRINQQSYLVRASRHESDGGLLI